MTSADLPYIPVSSKARYRQLLRWAEQCGGIELRVTADDWDVLLECIPGARKYVESRGSEGESLVHKGQLWRHKPPTRPLEGIYDLTGPDGPVRIYE